jgi:signal transduction histidine kinase
MTIKPIDIREKNVLMVTGQGMADYLSQEGIMDWNPTDYEENIKTALEGLKRRETDIVRLIDDTVQGISRPEGITVSFTKDIADHLVWVDEERIFKALANLATNAVEAMPEGGELTINMKGDEDQVTITIKDTGHGISEKNMDNLFTPFFTTKPVGEGTGLGLPFAYGAIKMHSGQLTIESNADASKGPTGTRIKIILPRARPDLSKVIIDEE